MPNPAHWHYARNEDDFESLKLGPAHPNSRRNSPIKLKYTTKRWFETSPGFVQLSGHPEYDALPFRDLEPKFEERSTRIFTNGVTAIYDRKTTTGPRGSHITRTTTVPKIEHIKKSIDGVIRDRPDQRIECEKTRISTSKSGGEVTEEFERGSVKLHRFEGFSSSPRTAAYLSMDYDIEDKVYFDHKKHYSSYTHESGVGEARTSRGFTKTYEEERPGNSEETVRADFASGDEEYGVSRENGGSIAYQWVLDITDEGDSNELPPEVYPYLKRKVEEGIQEGKSQVERVSARCRVPSLSQPKPAPTSTPTP